MPTDPIDSPLDKLLASAQQNVAGTALANASQQMVTGYPTPGSLEKIAKDTGKVICKQCQALNSPAAMFCRNCGSPLAAGGNCTDCHSPTKPGDKFCAQCGSPLPKQT